MTTQALAYRVPFVVEVDRRRIIVTNASSDDLPWVRLELVGTVLATAIAPGRMPRGASVEMLVSGTEDVAVRTRLHVTWMRAAGDGPYVWLSGL